MIGARSISFIKHATALNRRRLHLWLTSSSSSNLPLQASWLPSPLATRPVSVSGNTAIRSRNLSSKPKDPHQEAIDKAQQLHAELQEMIAAQKAAQKIAREQPYSTSILSFLKSAKPQIFNIFFAFLCVLLAYQIHGLRKGYKKLLDKLEERDGEIGRLRGVLRAICDVGDAENVDGEGKSSGESDEQENNSAPSFALLLSEKCTVAIQSLFAQSDNRPGYTWILARKLASGDMMESSRVTDAIQQVIAEEVRNFAGDVVFTEEELKKRRVEELKGDTHDLAVLREGMGSGSEGQMSGLVEMLQQVHEEDLLDDMKSKEVSGSSEGGKVKRMRYAI